MIQEASSQDSYETISKLFLLGTGITLAAYKSETVSKVASTTIAIFSDLCLMPLAAGLLAAAYAGYNFNPTVIKEGLPAIVLLHGSGFNESEFVIGRYFLNKPKYGSVFSSL